ncbi:MAG: alpha/beta hydrolase [Bacteroidota bacterium]
MKTVHARFLPLFFLPLLMTAPVVLNGQIEVAWFDSTSHQEHDRAIFFTNRKPKKTDDGSLAFRNRWTRQTDNLYFCLFDFENDSILLKYRATKTSGKYEFPTRKVGDNIFYKVYEDLRIDRGIRNINFIVPGYAKTFENQVYSYMYRLQKYYADTLQENTVFITFAWGDQATPMFYYKGKRSANRAANDFAIFQHMLEDFLSDSAYFATHPDDVRFKLVCMSMGNQLLKRYMIKREQQDIDFYPTYDWTVFIGSDASNDSFEEGKGFDDLHLMSDSVLILVNRKDGPLRMSQWMNTKTRMGLSGPRDMDEVPGNVVVKDITGLISWEDLPAMGHDYFLRNHVLRDSLIHVQSRTYPPLP